MSRIRFQLDEHVASAVADGLKRRGVDVVTAAEAGVLGAPDSMVLATAHAAGRVLVTHDDDFLRLGQGQRQHPGIAFCHQGTRTKGQLIADLVLLWEVLESDGMTGRVEYL